MPRRVSSAEQVAGQILAILRAEGVLSGDRIVESRLAAQLGVSRGPVRVALQKLAEAGVVATIPNRGFVLAKEIDSKVARAAVEAATAGDRAYHAIADDRLDGRLTDTVSEAEMMRRYGLKRAELLRLLDRIAGEGWVARAAGYGWRFAETLTGPDAYSQAGRFRGVIEPAAILEPKFALAPAVIAQLRQRQREILSGGLETLPVAAIFQSGYEFHEEIARAAGNPFYLETLKRVNAIRRLFAYRAYADHDAASVHIRDHLALLDLIEAGRLAEAAKLMRRHLGGGDA